VTAAGEEGQVDYGGGAMVIGLAVIQPGHRVLYREAHILLGELPGAQLEGAARPTWLTSRPSRC
jgi:hypothetical protein